MEAVEYAAVRLAVLYVGQLSPTGGMEANCASKLVCAFETVVRLADILHSLPDGRNNEKCSKARLNDHVGI